ncbi:MAG: hypothetical protein U0271_36370 [Polyangiaceae bacterium]
MKVRKPSKLLETLAALAAFGRVVTASSAASADNVTALPHVREDAGVAATTKGVAFVDDVMVGAGILFADFTREPDLSLLLEPEIGYSGQVGAPPSWNAFDIGFGVGISPSPVVMVVYTPRLLLGTYGGAFAPGMRNSLGVHFLYGAFDIDLGHEFVDTQQSTTMVHSFVATLGVDPVAIIWFLSMAAGGY